MTAQQKILLVDDERDVREALRARLTAEGYTVAAVGSGQEAIDAAAAQAFDLILLDMLMPGKGGYTTLQEIRADPAIKPIPVILLTAVAAQGQWEVVPDQAFGQTFIMGKPLDHAVLLERIRYVLTTEPEAS